MGYYADLIKQKEEKRNFRADPLGFGPTVVGMGTPDDYKAKFKVGDKVKFYSGEGVIVKGPIKMRFSLTPTYHIKVTTGKEAGREVSRYEEELKKNSKEEKDNEAPEIATARRKALQKLEDAQKKANWYGDETMKKLKHDLTYADEENLLDVVGVLERYLPKFEAKVKSFGNEKEEKDNNAESHLKGLIGKKFKRDSDLERAVNGSIYTEISDWSHPRMVVFDKYTDEKYILTTEDNNQYGKDQEFWISKVQKANSKEEKENADSAYIEASQKAERIINRMLQSRDKKEAKRFLEKIGWETRTLGEDPADYARAIRRAVRNYPEKSAEILSNEKEEGYYAKLAEEKKAKNNSRSWRIEFLGDSYYIETIADCDRALGKARQLWLAKEKALDDDIRWLKESFAKFERELGKIESEISKQGAK